MELSDLRVFRAVVDEGGITRAAEKLHRVQSSVTARIQQLEEDLGVALFVRQGRKLHLAPAGQVLVGYADRLLALAETAREAVADPRPRGLFRLGSMESTAAVRLPSLFAEYHRLYPDVTLELRTGHSRGLATEVLAGEIDAALAAEPIPDEPFEKVFAFREPLVIVAPAGHPALDGSTPVPRTIITFETGCPHRMRLEKWFADRDAMPERIIEMTSYHAILGCVVVGMGISLMPRGVLDTFPDRHRLALYDLPPELAVADTMLFWRKGGGAPKIDALAGLLGPRPADRTV